MTFYPEGGHVTMVAAGDPIRAVGWLNPHHRYPKGRVPRDFARRLRQFARRSRESEMALGLPTVMGWHRCEYCWLARGSWNFGVPAGEVLYVAPEMIAHYVRWHWYRPPHEFIEAVRSSPLPGTIEYERVVDPFRRNWLHSITAHTR